MGNGEIALLISLLVCAGIIVVMALRFRSPQENQEHYGEVIKKYQFVDPDFRENGIRVRKTIFSISFLIDGKKKTYYCREGFYHSVEAGDKVKIIHNKSKIIDLIDENEFII